MGYPRTWPGAARLHWSFMVHRTRDDDEDDCNDWGEEWERDWRNDQDGALLLQSIAGVSLPIWEPAVAVESWGREWMLRQFAREFGRPQARNHPYRLWIGLGYEGDRRWPMNEL